MKIEDYRNFSKFIKAQKGLMTLSDLLNTFNPRSKSTFFRVIQQLKKEGILIRFSKGLYVTENCSLERISQQLCPKSYLSLGTILAQELVIGTVPAKTVYAVKMGKSRTYISPIGRVVHLGIAPRLFFGFTYKDGIGRADKEKAFLDALYFYQSGHKFSFNIYSDIYVEDLDRKKITRYLRSYDNPKFISFVKGVLDA